MVDRLTQIPRNLLSRIDPDRTASYQAQNPDTTELSELIAEDNDDNLSEALNDSSGSPSKHAVLRRIYRLKQSFTGWRFGVLHFAVWTSVVCIINLTITIWGSARYKTTGGTLSEGDCGRIKNLNRVLHILINFLSTILLSGSNYCMQCLSAPTRIEVDKAHAEKRWLDIGVPSLRNLRHIRARRLYLWLLLGLSSIPVHFL